MRGCTIAARWRAAAAVHEPARQRPAGTVLALRCAGVRGGMVFMSLALLVRVAHAAPSVVARVGDPSPLGLPFSRFSDASVDDRARVAFVGGSTVLFRRAGDALLHVAGAGDVLLGRTLAGVGPPARGGDCLAFRAAFVDGGVAILAQCGPSPTLVAEAGLPAPGGGVLAGLGDVVAIDAGGRVAFTAVLDDGATGLFVDDAGGLREVTRTGRASPARGTFSGLRLIGVSSTGRVAFRGLTSGGPDGLFYSDGGAVAKLAVVGDASPVGGTFTSVGFGSVNDAGTWAFRAAVSSGKRSGVFRAPAGSTLAAVALAGDPAPIGGAFDEFPTALAPAINDAGQIAFRATVRGAAFPSGAFVALSDGTLEKAVAVGEDTAPGALARLREIALADDGSVIVRATLAGGTPGLFRASVDGVASVAVLGDPTDLGAGFRFSDPSAGSTADDVVFVGTREALFVADPAGTLRAVAGLGDETPVRGRYAGFDPPAAGGGLTVFGAAIQGGRAGESLFGVARRRTITLAETGDRVGRGTTLLDLFANPLDDLARAGVGAGAVAFQAGLGGGGGAGATGIVLWSGGVRVVARADQQAPGGGRFREFGSPVSGRGRVMFVASTGDNDSGLYRTAGERAVRVAAAGGETRTRLRSVFRGFGTLAARGGTVAFRATLDQARDAVFVTRGRCVMALAGTGESEPGGGKFRSFGTPAFAARTVVFGAAALGGSAASALYRATPSRTCTQLTPPVEILVAAGAPSPAGPVFLGFGTPSGNRHGTIAFAADLTGAGPTDAIFTME